jgi:hypothetical protein
MEMELEVQAFFVYVNTTGAIEKVNLIHEKMESPGIEIKPIGFAD